MWEDGQVAIFSSRALDYQVAEKFCRFSKRLRGRRKEGNWNMEWF